MIETFPTNFYKPLHFGKKVNAQAQRRKPLPDGNERKKKFHYPLEDLSKMRQKVSVSCQILIIHHCI